MQAQIGGFSTDRVLIADAILHVCRIALIGRRLTHEVGMIVREVETGFGSDIPGAVKTAIEEVQTEVGAAGYSKLSLACTHQDAAQNHLSTVP